MPQFPPNSYLRVWRDRQFHRRYPRAIKPVTFDVQDIKGSTPF
jgi:hypothetical protein